MRMKASEVGGWLRQIAGKRDHREVVSDDYLVLRPGPNFDLLNPVPAQAPPLKSERSRGGADRREADDHTE
jgi:hypothetical protein